MTTPESTVKTAVKKALLARGLVPLTDVLTGNAAEYPGFFWMPIQGAFAVRGVHDFVGCWNGIFWSIETKAPNNPEDATTHQMGFREAVLTSGGLSYVGVRDASVVEHLERAVRTRIEEYST